MLKCSFYMGHLGLCQSSERAAKSCSRGLLLKRNCSYNCFPIKVGDEWRGGKGGSGQGLSAMAPICVPHQGTKGSFLPSYNYTVANRTFWTWHSRWAAGDERGRDENTNKSSCKRPGLWFPSQQLQARGFNLITCFICANLFFNQSCSARRKDITVGSFAPSCSKTEVNGSYPCWDCLLGCRPGFLLAVDTACSSQESFLTLDSCNT